jgi:hypothetical protein
MTVCMVISLPKIPYIHRIYLQMYGSGQPYFFSTQVILRINLLSELLSNSKAVLFSFSMCIPDKQLV